MNNNLWILFLVVGCFGQDLLRNPTSSAVVPNAPSSPGVLSIPSSPGVPSIPSSPGVPSVPSRPGVPSVPSSPSVPSIPSIPVVPGVPSSPGVPSVPSSPSVPSIPSIPAVPGVPSSPGVPSVPSSPSVPSIPSSPALPNIPSGNVPAVPSTPVDSVIANVPLLTGLQSKIERPCQTYDIRCIRQYFLKNAHCKPAKGTVPDPLFRTLSNQFYARVNITNTNVNIRNRGLNNARIEEFYINRDTDKLVMGILFQGLSQSTNDSFFRYHRRGKEPIITHGYASVTFSSLYVTAIIPQVENLRLDKADVFAFSNDLIPKIDLDPKLAESLDPLVQRMFAEFLLNVPVDVAEFLLTESAYYAAAYIQYVICDFGLELV